MKTTNTNTSETNFEIGFRMQKEGYGISDSFGSAIATGDSTTPTDSDIEEWVKGYNASKELTTMKQTPIQWLCMKLSSKLGMPNAINFYVDHQVEIYEALEMEKEKFILAHINGQSEHDENAYDDKNRKCAEQYFNETYENK
jgi:hypothetical protein